MDCAEVVKRLQQQRGKLTTLGVTSLMLFGSVARGAARPESDVDLLVEFSGPVTFDRYIRLKDFLEGVLGHPVDLLTRKGIRPQLLPHIEQDAAHVA